MDTDRLKSKAGWVRYQVLEMITSAGHGHIGGSLSAVEILVALYQGELLHHDPRQPEMELRDRFIMSKGHAAEVLYAVLADEGFFDVELLQTYGKPGSRLGGHVDHHLPGIEVSTGSLGHGLGLAAGLALAAKLDNKEFLSVALMGDGECYEGSVWESAMFGAHHRLGRLVAIVDRNRQITLDYTEAANQLEPFADKWRAFGWEVIELDGHAFEEICQAWGHVREHTTNKPVVLIANTIKGKGISFMEGDLNWHHNVPKGEQMEIAARELASDV
jgi:transketolase